MYEANQVKNKQIVNLVNDALIDLWNDVNKKDIPRNDNPDKEVDIIEKILDNRQNGRRN